MRSTKTILPILLLLCAVHLLAQGPTAADQWKPYKSMFGGYKLEFPGTAKESIHNDDNGGNFTASVETQDTVFLAEFTRLKSAAPRDRAELVLEGAEEGLRAHANAKIVTKEKLTVDGLPARRFRYFMVSDGQELAGESLVVFAGDRLYQFMVMHAPPGPDQQDAAKFFSSISLQGVQYTETSTPEPETSDSTQAQPKGK